MRRKKRQFHCNQCSSPCEIYKKGKKHRVLVCPHCGVLATNPTLPFFEQRQALGKKLAKSGAISAIPLVGGFAQSLVDEEVAKDEAKDLNTSSSLSSPRRSPRRSVGDRLLKLIQAERLLGR